MRTLAPIGLSAYSRVEVLKQTVEALQKNTLAKESELYVFSDAAKPGDEDKVKKVRNYLKTLDGFKNVTISERDKNNRIANNRDGMRWLLDNYGKIIFLEEDVVTAPGFLEFINEGLTIYKEREDIFAICGYTPPVKLERYYKKDVYLSPRFSAWGFGIWADRYDKIIIDKIDFNKFIRNKSLVRRFRRGGEDLLSMLKREAEGEINALDVRIFYTQFLLNAYTVAPTRSLTNNIGFDGTGVHCGVTKRFEVSISKAPFQLEMDKDIEQNNRVIKSLYRFRSENHYGPIKKMIDKIWRYILRAIKIRHALG